VQRAAPPRRSSGNRAESREQRGNQGIRVIGKGYVRKERRGLCVIM